ncbi:MAG: hypothetical protein QOI38_329 [Sphingomonadales bacterium]|jgi:hypothetical protein|nr:hypothetical protein [Sphingomonadales bacterium]
MELPAEFALLVACCRRPPSTEAEEAVRRAAAAVDWPLLLATAARHRVEGLVHDGLRRAGAPVPAEAAEKLAAEASGIARENLLYAAEALRLSERFERAGIAHLFVKGVTLNILAYGTLALKRSRDIDLLVAPEDYAAACGTLAEAGYRCIHPPGADLEGVLRYAAAAKDSAWRSEAGIKVELHQRLTENPMLLPGVDARSPAQRVEIAPGVSLPTLRREQLFAYLCAHGAFTAWSRLKWLADLAALVAGEEEAGIERLYRHAAALAPGRAAAQALLLAHRLFGTRLGPALEAELRADRVTLYLERTALVTMAGGGARELGHRPFGAARLNLSVLMLQPGWRYKAAEIGRKLPSVPRALRAAMTGRRAP